MGKNYTLCDLWYNYYKSVSGVDYLTSPYWRTYRLLSRKLEDYVYNRVRVYNKTWSIDQKGKTE